ncbi:hypothetical protein V8J88_15790 [Massilia sp. W12]|uniref:hypothetical protein n=1 Tax=Massilia sp. W12 TaxID=3126507 RepID=UPI0030CC894B
MNFVKFIQNARKADFLVVQPRMGFTHLRAMQQGLAAVKAAGHDPESPFGGRIPTIGTITLDSYTRVRDDASARRALDEGRTLNGFPICAHGADATGAMLYAIQDETFPIQVRHGCPTPEDIFKVLIQAGIDATEGGPASYCLPYSRTPLKTAIASWRACSEMLGEEAARDGGHVIHLESFGGCMLGQLCPPELLVAISVLECIFFQTYGVKSVSMSYAQGTSMAQDIAALAAMRRLAHEYLTVDWHVVLYTYMGVFPLTVQGATDLLSESVFLARAKVNVAAPGQEEKLERCADRIIVKTPAEAHRIPTIAENMASLTHAHNYSRELMRNPRALPTPFDDDLYTQAKRVIESVLAEAGAAEGHGNYPHLDLAFDKAFKKGLLDVPFCLHIDNAKKSRAYIDKGGALRWLNVGNMALEIRNPGAHPDQLGPEEFRAMLAQVQAHYDDKYFKNNTARMVDGANPALLGISTSEAPQGENQNDEVVPA